MNTNEKTLKEIYNIGSDEVKKKLQQEFPTLFKKETLLEQAIEYLTETDEEVIKLRKLQTVLEDDCNILAEQKLICIFKFKNEKHIFDWDDSKEYKWFNWFYIDNFRFYASRYYYTDSYCSTRLCLKSKELVDELKDNLEILSLFETYLKQ